jgi:hypothetical protein
MAGVTRTGRETALTAALDKLKASATKGCLR